MPPSVQDLRHRFKRGAAQVRRERCVKDKSARIIHDGIDPFAPRRHEAAERAERFGTGPNMQIDIAKHAELFGNTSASCAKYTDSVRIVDR